MVVVEDQELALGWEGFFCPQEDFQQLDPTAYGPELEAAIAAYSPEQGLVVFCVNADNYYQFLEVHSDRYCNAEVARMHEEGFKIKYKNENLVS